MDHVWKDPYARDLECTVCGKHFYYAHVIPQCTGMEFTFTFDLKEIDKCECGSFKTYGIKKNEIGHSWWCPWSKK